LSSPISSDDGVPRRSNPNVAEWKKVATEYAFVEDDELPVGRRAVRANCAKVLLRA
jgi:hypothetical protein